MFAFLPMACFVRRTLSRSQMLSIIPSSGIDSDAITDDLQKIKYLLLLLSTNIKFSTIVSYWYETVAPASTVLRGVFTYGDK